jgi:pimeloyl-ACP methyl ester carboxylesterase
MKVKSMSIPLSIAFAKDCAYAAGADWVSFDTETGASKPALASVPITSSTWGSNLHEPDPNNNGQFAGLGRNQIKFAFHGHASNTGRIRMGYLLVGTGRRKGEVLITFRGSYYASDFLGIDAAFALGTSPKGWAVHGGFAKVIQTCLPEITEILRRIPNIHTVHCCGHSMGGALATLAAEHFCESQYKPYLYTFGAPRVGLMPHSNYMQNHMGENIYRYYYYGDVVTWLPMWPFVHLPGKRLVTSRKFAAGHNDYLESRNLVLAAGLGSDRQSKAQAWDAAETLIEQGGSAGGGYGFESQGLRYFMMALNKILYAIGGLIGVAAVPSVTVIDQIVAVISYFVQLGSDRVPLVLKWIVGAAKLLGKAVSIAVTGIVGTLRYVLNIMVSAATHSARRELSAVEAWRSRYAIARPVVRFT